MKKSSLEKIEEYKKELLILISDPILNRIIGSYNFPNPVQQLEAELDKILLEALNEDDKEINNSGF